MIELIAFFASYSLFITIMYVLKYFECLKYRGLFDNYFNEALCSRIKINKLKMKYQRKRDPKTGRFTK